MYPEGMAWLNYHHLLYFWTVAEEGTIARASLRLGLTQPTISGQLRSLEKSLGKKLFERSGRNLVLSEAGQVVYGYARQIFTLGRELQETLDGRTPGSPLRLVVGVADTMPELVVYRLIDPALRLPEPVQIICESGKPDELLAQLALHQLDVVLVDAPVTPFLKVRASIICWVSVAYPSWPWPGWRPPIGTIFPAHSTEHRSYCLRTMPCCVALWTSGLPRKEFARMFAANLPTRRCSRSSARKAWASLPCGRRSNAKR